jgi:hypothetical protein
VYALNGTIEPTRISPTYRAGLLVVAITMLVLPLVYVGLIVLAGSLVWWHLTANTWILSARSAGVWKLVAYLAPAVAGAIVVFFMIKPILARPAKRVDPLPLWPDDEPELHRRMRDDLTNTPAPEANESSAPTLAALLRLNDAAQTEVKTAWVLEATFPVYFGVLGRLVEISAIVEGALDVAAG